jgi:site-specific DNA recombinase
MTTTLDAPIRPRVASKHRAAIYSRVSSVIQEGGASLTTQKADCTRYAEANGLIVTHEYLDIQSGLESDRAQYQAMLRTAQAGEFDRIIVWKMDRFGRDRIESGFQLRALQQVGVKVDSATEPNDSPLLRNILMDFAEEESRRISLRVSANQRTRAQGGKRTSKAPFGYSNVAHPDGGVALEPNEDAPVVTEAFQMYASGRYTLSDLRDYISKATNTTNRPQTRAGIHNLLKNPTYAGINRHGFYARSKIQVKSQEEKLADVVEVEDCHAALIDKTTFQKVQERLESNRPNKSGRAHPAFLFTGLLWCGCGARYSAYRHSGGGKAVYYCVRKNNAGTCDSRSVSETRLREAVLTPIKELMERLSQEDMRKAVREELTRQQAAASNAIGSQVSQREKLEARLSKLEDSYLDGDIARDRYLIKRNEILAQLADLKEAAHPQRESASLDELFALADAVDIIDGAITIAGEAVSDQWWRDIIEGLVERIVIDGREIKVEWKPIFRGVLETGHED